MLGLFVLRPIVYKPLWDTFVFRFEFYEIVSFLSSLEVLLRTTDPYLWISDSKWQIFLTYLGTSSKWRDFIPFREPPNRRPPFSPFVLGFIPILVLDEFPPQIRDVPSSSRNQSSVDSRSIRFSFNSFQIFVLLVVLVLWFWCYGAFSVCALSHSLKQLGAWISLPCLVQLAWFLFAYVVIAG